MPDVPALVVNTNTFGTLQEADDYLAISEKAQSLWDFSGQCDPERERLLLLAYRILSRMPWKGEKSVAAQPGPFPRDGLTDREGEEIADGSTPDDIKHAQFELALALKEESDLESRVEQGDAIESIKAGPVRIKFDKTTLGTKERMPDHIFEILQPYMYSQQEVYGVVFSSTKVVDNEVDESFDYL